jgi:hypothetical protein
MEIVCMYINFEEQYLGSHFGRFFADSSGHPAWQLDWRNRETAFQALPIYNPYIVAFLDLWCDSQNKEIVYFKKQI